MPIDEVGIEHELDILEWDDGRREAQVNKDVSGLRVRPASPQFEEVGCVHAPANLIAAPQDFVQILATPRDAGCVEGGAFAYGLGWRQAIRACMCVGRKHRHAVQRNACTAVRHGAISAQVPKFKVSF